MGSFSTCKMQTRIQQERSQYGGFIEQPELRSQTSTDNATRTALKESTTLLMVTKVIGHFQATFLQKDWSQMMLVQIPLIKFKPSPCKEMLLQS